MIIVDASVLAPALIDSDPDGSELRSLLSGHELAAPQLLDLEIMSIYRRHSRTGKVSKAEADAAVQRLSELPVERFPHGQLVDRIWELRDNVTSYDAAYIALAEALQAPLWTRDRRLANAPGIKCRTVVPSSGLVTFRPRLASGARSRRGAWAAVEVGQGCGEAVEVAL